MNYISAEKLTSTRDNDSSIIISKSISRKLLRKEKIFIVGPPRSGTTLIYSMVSKDYFLPECTFVSTIIKVFDEIYKYSDEERFNYYCQNLSNLVAIFQKPIFDFLFTALQKSNAINKHYIFKDPMLTLYLEYFPLFFRNTYKIVFCLRDPRDTVSSMYKVLKTQQPDFDNNSLFEKTINLIFPFYQTLYDIDNGNLQIQKDKLLLVQYEQVVKGDVSTIQNLENFLGFKISASGINHNVKGKLDENSAFFSENYGKEISTKPIGNYKKTLSTQQISRIEEIFVYYLSSNHYYHNED